MARHIPGCNYEFKINQLNLTRTTPLFCKKVGLPARWATLYAQYLKDSQNFDPFMALELLNNGFRDIKGKFYEDSAFESQPEELVEFEKNFPFREKHKTATQFK